MTGPGAVAGPLPASLAGDVPARDARAWRGSAARWSRRRAARRLAACLPILLLAPAAGVLSAYWPAPSAAARRARVARTVQRVSRWLLRALGVRVTVRGPRPPAGALVAANHVSWLDVLACAATWPSLAFVAKREVGTWPLVGTVVRTRGTAFVDRTRKRDLLRAIPDLEARLAAGETVCLFAEGTTSDGTDVLPFKSSLFEAAVRSAAPVVPLAIRASTPRGAPPASTHVAWWGETSLLAHLPRVAGLPHCTLALRVGHPIAAGADRKALARAARAAVRA